MGTSAEEQLERLKWRAARRIENLIQDCRLEANRIALQPLSIVQDYWLDESHARFGELGVLFHQDDSAIEQAAAAARREIRFLKTYAMRQQLRLMGIRP